VFVALFYNKAKPSRKKTVEIGGDVTEEICIKKYPSKAEAETFDIGGYVIMIVRHKHLDEFKDTGGDSSGDFLLIFHCNRGRDGEQLGGDDFGDGNVFDTRAPVFGINEGSYICVFRGNIQVRDDLNTVFGD
jgi:hypothetical protein